MIPLIGLLAAYKFGNAMASSISGPFLHDAGLTLHQIALVSGALSSAGALAGSALGGWLAFRYGRRSALLFGGVSQTLAVGLYVAAALGIGGGAMVISATVLEHVFGGAALVALLFNLLGNSGTHTALLLAGTFAVVAAAVSGLRVTQPRVRL